MDSWCAWNANIKMDFCYTIINMIGNDHICRVSVAHNVDKMRVDGPVMANIEYQMSWHENVI